MKKTRDPMQSLWAENPLPWKAGDNFPGREGELVVMNASGDQVIYIGNMEDCTASDIDLMYLIAAAPDLLALCECELLDYELSYDALVAFHEGRTADIDERMRLLRAAISKARGQ